MKTPDQILAEYAEGAVRCFHGHVLEWAEFAKCCEGFFKEHVGLRACYWLILERAGLPAEQLRVFRATNALSNELDNYLLDPAFALNRHVMDTLAAFSDPKNLMRFETKEELKAAIPTVKWDHIGHINDVTREALTKLYKKYLATEVRSVKADSARVMIETRLRDSKMDERLHATRKNFITYLETLTGRSEISAFEDWPLRGGPYALKVTHKDDDGQDVFSRVILTSLGGCTVVPEIAPKRKPGNWKVLL